MMVKMFITKETRTPVVINKEVNGSYSAYEAHTRGEGGNKVILNNVWCPHWLEETLHNIYDEELIREV